MSNYVRIIDDVAVDVVSGDPAELFHPTIAAEFSAAPDEVEPGWRRDPGTGAWSAPAPIEPQPEPPGEAPKVSPVEFKLLFTPQERVAIKSARATHPVIGDFYDIVEDPRLTFVDLGLQSTRDALEYMVVQKLLTDERRTAILYGQVQ